MFCAFLVDKTFKEHDIQEMNEKNNGSLLFFILIKL